MLQAVRSKGQLLRPDEDTLTARALVVDDERRAKSLQVLDGQFEILELELAAVEVDCSMRFQSEQPERNGHFDDPLIVWIEGEDEEETEEAGGEPAAETDNVGDPSVEINVEELIHELEVDGVTRPGREQAAKRRLEELMEQKRSKRDLEDFDDYDV